MLIKSINKREIVQATSTLMINTEFHAGFTNAFFFLVFEEFDTHRNILLHERPDPSDMVKNLIHVGPVFVDIFKMSVRRRQFVSKKYP